MVVTRVLALLTTAACLFAGFAAESFAQAPTTVQLPSFQFFTVSTSVLVPDRGTMSLGGISTAGTSALASGPFFPQSASGSTMNSSGMSISVQIHDMAELDAAVLAQTKSIGSSSSSSLAGTKSPASQSVAEAHRQHEQEVAAVDDQARDYYQRGLLAESNAQVGAAKVWYQMASRRATGAFKAEIDARLATLTRPPVATARR